MYLYSIPYQKESDHCRVVQCTSPEKKNALQLMRMFLVQLRHGYFDDTFDNLEQEQLLSIVCEQYKVGSVTVYDLESQKYVQTFEIGQRYYQINRLSSVLKEMENENEILLSSEIGYEGEIDNDEISVCIDGVEVFLFEFKTINQTETSEAGWSDGIVIEDEIEIETPVTDQNQIVDLFSSWIQKNNWKNLMHIPVRIAKENDFKERPFLDMLVDRCENDDERFSVPYELVHAKLKKSEKLFEMLIDEPAEVIACILCDFKDQTILSFLDTVPAKKMAVIHYLPQVPSLHLEERERFTKIFTYSPVFIHQRLEKLMSKYDFRELEQKKKLKESEKKAMSEYSLWVNCLANSQ
jgi:hypothetical protein